MGVGKREDRLEGRGNSEPTAITGVACNDGANNIRSRVLGLVSQTSDPTMLGGRQSTGREMLGLGVGVGQGYR